MVERIRVLVAEDHTIVREGICMILQAQGDIEVVGEAANGAEVIQLARELRPHVILMDITMPGIDGILATKAIKEELPDTHVVALTVHENDAYFFRMLSAGASGYVLKGAPSAELLAAIRAAHRGETFLHPSMVGKLVRDYLRRVKKGEAEDSYESLTEREKEVFKFLAEGGTNQEIANALTISVSTVQTHTTHIMEKLNLQSRAALIRYAIRRGLVDADI